MKAKYDRIGTSYNRTRKADSYLIKRLIHHLCPVENKKYLDIGCGTGNYTIALNEKGFEFVGVEPSKQMLNNAIARNSRVVWKSGSAEDIPLEENGVAGIIATLTTHHWNDLEKSFVELNRVLEPNGRIVIFTSNRDLMKGYWLNQYFPKMLEDSMSQMPTSAKTENALKKGGFEVVETEKYLVREDLEDLFLYSGKHNPKLYLDETFRNGISSFSDLANSDEVEIGLRALDKDIETGKIQGIIEKYYSNNGDYVFIIAKK